MNSIMIALCMVSGLVYLAGVAWFWVKANARSSAFIWPLMLLVWYLWGNVQ